MKSRLLVALIVVAALVSGVYFGWRLPRLPNLAGTTRTYNTATVIQQVQTLSELVTVKYVMEKIIIFEDVKWYGENRVMIVAHGIAKAGVDFGDLTPKDLTIEGTKVRIKLPRERLMDVYLDDKATEVIERTTGVLRQFDKDLEQNARRRAVDEMRVAARKNGILKDAKERAESQLTRFFKEIGFTEVEFASK
ncbi:MAG: hypothetical protein JWM99_369 [Verrucomicrobiales bacterium]|nr:hypothetical protein [Verrucomicrobiales bacterium]